jgi:hypothetical protein
MKRYIYGAIIGTLISSGAFWAFTSTRNRTNENPALQAWEKILQDYTNRNNHVVGASSAKSPDQNWTAWVSDEYSDPENKNYVSFAIYGSNGYEQTYTRFECHGGTARGSTINWSPNGSSVSASIRLKTDYAPFQSLAEIEYNFLDDSLTTQRISE